jgi:hypothetical protein
MRIRTIKPEFWSHPVMGRLPEPTQLLALAILSHADDFGYFLADPSIVRGACQPFREDLASIREDLARLSEAGWIEVSEHPEQGKIGRVVNWERHQRVDHPSASKLAGYFNRETLAKPSRETRAGTGNREQGISNTPPVGPQPPANTPQPAAGPAPADASGGDETLKARNPDSQDRPDAKPEPGQVTVGPAWTGGTARSAAGTHEPNPAAMACFENFRKLLEKGTKSHWHNGRLMAELGKLKNFAVGTGIDPGELARRLGWAVEHWRKPIVNCKDLEFCWGKIVTAMDDLDPSRGPEFEAKVQEAMRKSPLMAAGGRR